MAPDRVVTWSVRDSGLHVRFGDIDEAIIPPAQFPMLILAIVREMKREVRDREGR